MNRYISPQPRIALSDIFDDDEESPNFWPPGVSLPLHTPETPHSIISTPVRRLARDNDKVSIEGTLKSIMCSQREMQKQMETILHRVGAIEDTFKISSGPSSSTDEKKSKKLPAELCVC